MRYVLTCGYISFGFGPVVVVPGVLVHRVEGHTTGLYGPCLGAHDVPWDIKSASLEKFFPTMDCPEPDLDGFPQTLPFGGV